MCAVKTLEKDSNGSLPAPLGLGHMADVLAHLGHRPSARADIPQPRAGAWLWLIPLSRCCAAAWLAKDEISQ